MDSVYYEMLRRAKEGKEYIMCQKLREISGLNAEQLLELYGDTETHVYIDIEKILNKLNIHFDSMDFSSLEETIPDVIAQKGKILGAVTVINDDVNIFYSKDSTENRKRFTLAHELAHCCLDAGSLRDGHIEFRFDEASDDRAERAANIFAGKLLIPTSSLKKLYNELVIPLSDVLAKEFRVSIPVMEARLKDLNMPFYSPTV